MIRYIHQKHGKAGISKDLEYPFSSFSAYLDLEKSGIVDTEIPLAGMEYSEFLKMQYENNSDRCLAFPGKI